MKGKHILVSTGAAIIAGSIFYYLANGSKSKTKEIKPAQLAKTGEEKIRMAMHHAKESQS